MSLVNHLNEEISSIRKQRYQFLLIEICNYSEKDLMIVLKQLEIPTINVGMELASRLKNVPLSKRSRVVKDELQNIISEYKSGILFFSRIQYLFDEGLKQNPLSLIEYISGNTVIIVNWPGVMKNGLLKYGTPDHPEYFEANGYEDHITQL